MRIDERSRVWIRSPLSNGCVQMECSLMKDCLSLSLWPYLRRGFEWVPINGDRIVRNFLYAAHQSHAVLRVCNSTYYYVAKIADHRAKPVERIYFTFFTFLFVFTQLIAVIAASNLTECLVILRRAACAEMCNTYKYVCSVSVRKVCDKAPAPSRLGTRG